MTINAAYPAQTTGYSCHSSSTAPCTEGVTLVRPEKRSQVMSRGHRADYLSCHGEMCLKERGYGDSFCALPPAASAAHPSCAHSSTHRRSKVLAALLADGTCLLLLLQIGLWPARGLPSIAGVLGPVPTLPIVAIDSAVLTCVDVVCFRRDTGAGVRVIGEATTAGHTLPAIDIAGVSSTGSGNDSRLRIIDRCSSTSNRVSRIDICIGAASGYTDGSPLRIRESGAT